MDKDVSHISRSRATYLRITNVTRVSFEDVLAKSSYAFGFFETSIRAPYIKKEALKIFRKISYKK